MKSKMRDYIWLVYRKDCEKFLCFVHEQIEAERLVNFLGDEYDYSEIPNPKGFLEDVLSGHYP